ncbi:hypothetical protein LEMLEM_LOCUS5285 [Lemmus lemmus]
MFQEHRTSLEAGSAVVLSQGNTCYPPQVPGVCGKVFLKRTPDDPLSRGGPSLALRCCPFLPYGSRTLSGSSEGTDFRSWGDPLLYSPTSSSGLYGPGGAVCYCLPPSPPPDGRSHRSRPARPAAPPALPPPPQRSLGLRRPNFSPGASPAAAAPAHGRRAAGGLTPAAGTARPQPRAMAARAPPAAPAAEEPGSPGGPPRRKKSRSGLRRAFSWLRGKRRKKKAVGAEGADSATPRAKKADDKAKRAKGKGRALGGVAGLGLGAPAVAARASRYLPPGAAGPAAGLAGPRSGAYSSSRTRHGQLTPQEEGPQRPPDPQLLALRAIGKAAGR